MKHQRHQTHKPTLAIISETLRRDLQDPLKYFTQLRILHLYQDTNYRDLRTTDLGTMPIKYRDANELSRKLRELKPDLIQGPEPFASRRALQNAWAVYQYAKRTGTPYFFPSFENRPPSIKFGPIVGPFMLWVLGRYAARAAGVISLNRGVDRTLKAAGIPKAAVAHLMWGTWGIDTYEFAPAPGTKTNRPTVLFVGRISVKKGLDDLLSAWPVILEAVPTARLIVGGPALDEDSQSLLAQLRATPAAEYVGPIKNADLAGYFQRAWITLAPSVTTKTWEEQVGMVLLQSLSSGTPVVSTMSGAIPEYVGTTHGAVLVEEHDVSALARSTIELLQKPEELKLLGKLGRAHILKEYEVRKNVKRCEEYVLDLLKNQVR